MARASGEEYRAWKEAEEAKVAEEYPCRHCKKVIQGVWPIMYENVCRACLEQHYLYEEAASAYSLKCDVCGRKAKDCPSYPSCELGFEALRGEAGSQETAVQGDEPETDA